MKQYPFAGSLSDLANSYYQCAQQQSETIAAVRKQYNSLKKGNAREAYRLRCTLQSLYAGRRELLQTGAYLERYYRFSGQRIGEGRQ